MRAKIFSSFDCFCSTAIAFFNLLHALLTLEAVGVQARGELARHNEERLWMLSDKETDTCAEKR